MGKTVSSEEAIYQWFNHFHNYPEISWNEFETTKKIASILKEMNVPFQTFEDCTGLIAEIGQGEDVIAVRADIDALWQEVDGEMRANHSCGHDANISMVLGALSLIRNENFHKRIRFIFQPAEETGGGSLAMIDRNVLEDVTHLFGIHLRPQEELSFGKVTPAIHHGAAVFLQGKITGIDAHGARPHQGKNAIDVLFGIQQMLKNIYINPAEIYSAKLTKVVADGGSVNIIPGSATFSIDVRSQKNQVLEEAKKKVELGLDYIKKQFEIGLEWEWLDMTPGAEVSAHAAKIAELSIIESFGIDSLAEPILTPGSDDFHFYTVRKPSLQATMIGVGANLSPGLHHPNMTFEKEAMVVGAKVLAKTLMNASN